MELIKFFVEVRYSQLHRLFHAYEELYSSLTGQEAKEREPALLPGFGLNVKEKKMRVVVDPERCIVDLEYVPNPGYCVDTVLQTLRRISEVAALPSLRRLGARSWWIKPSQIEFNKLVRIYKEQLFQSNPFVDNSVDIGASFILNHEGYKANISFGPMEMPQLQDMLFSHPVELPPVLTFLDVDYYIVREGLEYSEKLIRDVAKGALEFAKQQSENLEAMLKE
mgnify:CR=1 FL=1